MPALTALLDKPAVPPKKRLSPFAECRHKTRELLRTAIEMQSELVVSECRTIWVMAHIIRKAMTDRDSLDKLTG